MCAMIEVADMVHQGRHGSRGYKKGCLSAPSQPSAAARILADSGPAVTARRLRSRRSTAGRLPLDGREDVGLAPTDLQRDRRRLVEPRNQVVELLRRFDFRRVALCGQRHDHVPGADVRPRLAAHLVHRHPARDVELAPLVVAQVADDKTEAVRRELGLLLARAYPAVRRHAIIRHLAHRQRDLLGLAFAPDLHRDPRARSGRADDPGQVGRGVHRLAVELEDDVAGLHAALLRRAAFLDSGDQRADRLGQAERIGQLLRDFLDHDPDAPAAHPPGRAQLARDVQRDVDRDREREPHDPAGAAVDLELIPTTSPLRLNSGPPELPGLIATSVWMNGTKFSCGNDRPFALTIPAVTVFSNPNGEPMATTHSPTLSLLGSPNRTAWSPDASILIRPTSVRRSTPMTRALNSRLSLNFTVISSAASTTWAFVRM